MCVLSPAAELGGAERSLLTLLALGHVVGLDATVILPRPGPLAEELGRIGVPSSVVLQPRAMLEQSRRPRPSALIRATALPLLLPVYLARLVAALRAQRPNVVYSNGVKMHIVSTLLRPWTGVPVVWHVRDFIGGRVLAALADCGPERVVVNSRAVGAHLRRAMRRKEKIVVVHNAVDVDRFSPDGPRSAAASTVAATFRVGLPAVLARWKGHMLLLKAAERIRAAVPGTVVFLIGGEVYDTVRERGYKDELRREIAARGLEHAVVLTGFQRDMPPWYRSMDVIVHASTQPEPFGRTVIEAMACGRPVVAACAGGIPELVIDGKTGVLYPMGDAEALADAVIGLLRDGAQRRRLGVAARTDTVARFAAAPHAAAVAAVLRAAAVRGDA